MTQFYIFFIKIYIIFTLFLHCFGMKIGIMGGEVVDFLIDVKDGVAYAESSGVKRI